MSAESSRPHRVLVVDDRSDVRSLLLDVLALLDCQAEEAADGEKALARFGEHPHDLVVTDLTMPGMSGWDVAHAIREHSPDVAVVLLTGFATTADADQAEAQGFTLLHKPVSIADFTETITRLLGGVCHQTGSERTAR